jgi:hypothetical protein
MLLINKCDLIDRLELDEASERGSGFDQCFRTSAKSGAMVESAFQTLAERVR